MKRCLRFLVSCCLLFFFTFPAHAIETKISGQWLFTFGWTENLSKSGGSFIKDKNRKEGKNVDSFRAGQRVRTQIDFIASEDVGGTVIFEIGTIDWGRSRDNVGQSSGGALDADGVNVETKRAYLNWLLPDSDIKVRMGIQAFHLPWAYGGYGANPVLSNEGTGIIISSPVTTGLDITAFWLRAFDAYERDTIGRRMDETDIFGVTLPITALADTRITPWGLYANIGADSGFWSYNGRAVKRAAQESWSGTDVNAWYAGSAFSFEGFAPISALMDVMYGQLNGGNSSLDKSTPSSKGWLIDAALRYKTDIGTFGLFSWYATGDDKNAIKDGSFGRLPVIGYDWGAGFTSFGFDGSSADLYSDWHVSLSAVGTWGLGLELVDTPSLENLSHTLRVAYYAGTNESALVKNNPGSFVNRQNNELFFAEFQYMTDKDSAFEVNFDHIYKIQDNFTAHLDIGYIHMDLDHDTWKQTNLGSKTDDAWKATLTFQYKF